MQYDAENEALYPKKRVKRLPKSVNRKKRTKAKPNATQTKVVDIPGGDGWANVPVHIKMDPQMWVSAIPSELWKIARAGVHGQTIKRDTIDFKYIPWQAFYAQIRSLLEQGTS